MAVDLLQILKVKGPLSLEVQTYLAGVLHHQSLRKKELILSPGQINDKMVFIQKGLLRAYSIKDGVEKGSSFRSEGEFMVSISAFYTGKKSIEYIQAVEQTEILYITREELYFIYDKDKDFCYNTLLLTIDRLLELDERIRSLIGTSTEERFKWLISHRSHLLGRVPARQLAGFLGMTPESFSKIRSMKYKAIKIS